jgi:hypothetical protein
MIRPSSIVIAVLVAPLATLSGADAVFSKDNTHIYLVQWAQQPARSSGECSLIDIDLGKQACAAVDLRDTVGAPLCGIACSDNESLLCATKSTLWRFDPATRGCSKLIAAPNGLELTDIAYDPSQRLLFATCRGTNGQELFCLPMNANRWFPVYNRRAAPVGFPVFGNDGRLYFSSRGDLWTGFLKVQTEPTLPALNAYSISSKTTDGWPKSIDVAELAAYRYAPVAFLETQNCTTGSTGLNELALSKNFVYGSYSRIGGSGWGSLIRCKRETGSDSGKAEREIPGGSDADGKQAVPVLQSVEQVADEPCVRLCASRDETRVFYQLRGERVFLIKDDEKPQAVVIAGLKNLL